MTPSDEELLKRKIRIQQDIVDLIMQKKPDGLWRMDEPDLSGGTVLWKGKSREVKRGYTFDPNAIFEWEDEHEDSSS